MSEIVAIKKLIEANFSNREIREMLSVKWYNIFKTIKIIKILINVGITQEELTELFSLQRGRPEYLTNILQEERTRKRELEESKGKRELAALESRQKESYGAASSPVTSEPRHTYNPFDPFGRGRW